MTTFEVGKSTSSSFYGVTGSIKNIKENGFMGYTEITVAHQVLAMGSSDDYRDSESTFVVHPSSDWT